MIKYDQYIANEVHRVLRKVPLTRAAKRDIRHTLLRDMDGQKAILLITELKARVEALEAVLDVIRGNIGPCAKSAEY